MEKDKLLPRGFRIIGIVMIISALTVFFNDTDSIFDLYPVFDDNVKREKIQLISLVKEEHVSTKVSYSFFQPYETEITNEILLTLMLVGTYFVAFSRIKNEDELSQRLRLESMTSAIVWNSAILLLFNWVTFDLLFFYVMISQLFSFLLIFSIIFAFKVRNLRKGLSNEE